MNTLRRFVASVLKLKYGVRGSLKPPLGGPHAGLLYPLRYHAWKLTNRLYHWSGLPAQWHAWTLAADQTGCGGGAMSDTSTIINALRILARDIQSDDGVANAAIAEAADRLQEQQERIRRLEEAGEVLCEIQEGPSGRRAIQRWKEAKEAKP